MYETVACGIIAALQIWTLKKNYDVLHACNNMKNDIDRINEFGCDKSRKEKERREGIGYAEEREHFINS